MWVKLRKDLQVQIERRENAADGALQFDVTLTARVRAFGRLQKWKSGVQLASVSMEADAQLRLRMRCRLAMELRATRFPPDVLLRPRVERADVELLEFQARRIGKLHGDLAEELGRGLRSTIERKIEQSEPTLAQKMNAKLAERRDDLRLSLADWAAAKLKEVSK